MAKQDPSYLKWYFERLPNCLSPSVLPDVTLSNGDIEIECHKVVLLTASDYFMKIFTVDVLEAKSDVVKLHWMSSQILTSLVRYIYSSVIDISKETVRDLVQAAEQLNLVPLRDLCDEFMTTDIAQDEALELYLFAKRHQLKEVKSAAWLGMLQNANQVLREKELHKLSFEDILQFLSNDHLKSEPVDLKFEMVCRWVEEDTSERHALMPKLLETVHLHLCDKQYLVQKVMYNELMLDKDCRVFVQEAITHNMMAATAATNMDVSLLSLVTVGGKADGKYTRDVMYLVEQDNSWARLTQTLQVLNYASAVGIPGGLMVTGGQNESSSGIRECHMFDATAGKWKALSPMRHARRWHCCVYHSGNVYVTGGSERSAASSSVEVYNLYTDTWTDAPDMPHPTVYGQTTYAYSCGNRLCVLMSTGKTMQVYDGAWHTIKLPPNVTFGTCGAAVKDLLYLLMKDKTFYRYNFHTQAWTKLTAPQDVHSYGSAKEREGKIVVLGGNTNIVEEYSVTEDSWRTISQLPYKQYQFCSLVTIDTGLLSNK